MDKTLEDLIIRVINQGASDLHIGEGRQPIIRVNGDLIPISEYPVLTKEQAKNFLYQLIPQNYQKEFETKQELDFSFQYKEEDRFRGNAFIQQGRIGFVMRLIPKQIKNNN